MRKHDLRSRKRRAVRVHTTESKHAHPIAPNVLERDFNVTAPNQKWLADLTYVPTAEGWRAPDAGLLHHSDRGSQYAANDYRNVLKARGITVSMSRKGNCWDNAPMEPVNGTVKVECVHGEHFKTRAQAHHAIIKYIGYYNTVRRHSSLGYVPPAQFERRWRAEGKNLTEARLQ